MPTLGHWAASMLSLALVAGCDGPGSSEPPMSPSGEPDEGLDRPECVGDEARPCPGGPGEQRCVDGRWGSCQVDRETCDGADEDGDGLIDEGLVEPCGSDVGVCVPGVRVCGAGVWGQCIGAATGGAEQCDGLDNDCDGATDEGPIITAIDSLIAPTPSGPTALSWTGRAFALAVSGFPNWVIHVGLPDATVWAADLVGRLPADLDLAAGPEGLVTAWTERSGGLWFGRLGWGDDGLAPAEVPVRADDAPGRASTARLAGQTRSTLVAWLDDRDGVRPWGVVLDPATGSPRFDPVALGGPDGATGLEVANNGEDGFAVTWRVAPDDGAGPIWFARLNNGGAAPDGAFLAADVDATDVDVIADYYADTFALAWTDGAQLAIGQFARDARSVESTTIVADDQVAIGDVRLIREESLWAVFWSAGPSDGVEARMVYGRLYERGGRALTSIMPLMPAGDGLVVDYGVDRFGVATTRDGRLWLLSGPLTCTQLDGP